MGKRINSFTFKFFIIITNTVKLTGKIPILLLPV